MTITITQLKQDLVNTNFANDYHVDIIEQEDALQLTFRQYGDLPVVLAVSEKQILVESVLVERNEFQHPEQIDYQLLKSHKYLPLSTIAIDNIAGIDYYVLFGALSVQSQVSELIEELLALVTNTMNVIDALEPLYKFNQSELQVKSQEIFQQGDEHNERV
ncbi:DUF2170 family protein [Flocculibacter collagenilyticus]|uniref:DUF2170 family protein n=1 Tax=Flocculibacter collagenilyticus TaxID=2744479 RepID=UPI0018F344F3|nr:DUF2170 family protein [Flocculibacter collagenilyticus]